MGNETNQNQLRSFCQQFDLSIKNPTNGGTCSKPCSKPFKPFHKQLSYKYRKYFHTKCKPYYQVSHKKPTKNFQFKPKFDTRNITCYKCGQKDHTYFS